MKLSLAAVLSGAALGLQFASASVSPVFVSEGNLEEATASLKSITQKQPKHAAFAKVMDQIEKADKDYFKSGNFDPNCPESYDFLFSAPTQSSTEQNEDEQDESFKFNLKIAARVLGYLIEAQEQDLSQAIVNKWIRSREWKQHNRKGILKDLKDLIAALKSEPKILISTFKALVESAAVEIVHEDSWTSVVASIVQEESKLTDLSDQDRDETVAFLIDHFFRVADEDQPALSKKVLQKLAKRFEDADEKEIMKWYLNRFQALFAHPSSTAHKSVPKKMSALPSRNRLPQLRTSFLDSRSMTAQRSDNSPSTSSSLLNQQWYENTWLWVLIVATFGIILALFVAYVYLSKKRSVNL